MAKGVDAMREWLTREVVVRSTMSVATLAALAAVVGAGTKWW